MTAVVACLFGLGASLLEFLPNVGFVLSLQHAVATTITAPAACAELRLQGITQPAVALQPAPGKQVRVGHRDKWVRGEYGCSGIAMKLHD